MPSQAHSAARETPHPLSEQVAMPISSGMPGNSRPFSSVERELFVDQSKLEVLLDFVDGMAQMLEQDSNLGLSRFLKNWLSSGKCLTEI